MRLLEEIYSSMLNSTNHNSKKKYIYWKRKKLATKNKKQKTGERTIFELPIWISLKLKATNYVSYMLIAVNLTLPCYVLIIQALFWFAMLVNQKILFLYFYWLYYILDYVNQVSTCSFYVYYDHLFMLPPSNQSSTNTCCV